MMQAVDRNTAEHYQWGNACDGWRLLDRHDLAVTSERVPPGAAEIRHYHAAARQFFYILSGSATMELDGSPVSLQAGQGLEVPPGTPHRFLNESTTDVHFLVISHPATRDDRIES